MKILFLFLFAFATIVSASILNLNSARATESGVLSKFVASDPSTGTDARPTISVGDRELVRVLIRLNVSFTPQDTLDKSRSRQRRSEIVIRQNDLLQRIGSTDLTLIHRFIDTPFLILAVDQSAIERLRADASVAEVIIDGSTQPESSDREMADEISRLTDRTTDGLFEEVMPGGAVRLDVHDRFQNVPIAMVEENGDVSTGCVTSLDEGNGFFGRDLETGEPKPTSRAHERLMSGHSNHPMTEAERRFYEQLIEMAASGRLLAPGAAELTIVNNDGPSEGLNDSTPVTPVGGNTGTTLGQQRLNVITTAANIWGAFLDSSVTILIRSQFDPLTCSSNSAVLGSAGAVTFFRDYQNAGLAGTWHPIALANKQAGTDLVPANPDVNMTFNSNLGNPGCLTGVPFYLGIDNNAPGNSVNLLTTVLHEMGHGLGFITLVNGQTGALANGFPDVYMVNMYDRTQDKFWTAMTATERQASAINPNNVLWDGANIRTASGFLTNGRDAVTGRVELFTPNPFQSGSSLSHFNSRAFPNLLMEPASSPGLPLTLDLTRQQMRDIGWYRDANADLIPDTITNVQPSGTAIVIGSPATISWTNTTGFDRNVTIEMSSDGGTTFTTTLASGITNTGSFTFTVPNNPTSQARFRVREHDFVAPSGVSAVNVTITTSTPTPTPTPTPTATPTPTPTPTPVPGRAIADFDGDGRTDVSVYRDDPGVWFWQNSSNGGTFAAGFGIPGDTIVPGDYDGDGKADLALYRSSTGTWWVNRSGSGNVSATGFGTATDIPAQGDFDGDGRTDIAIYRPSTGEWWLNQSSAGVAVISFGLNGDKPVPGDYDGDGKTDIAIYRPSTGHWFIRQSSGGVLAVSWGIAEDKVVPGDYDGDGRADIALYRPSTGQWFIVRSTLGVFVDSWGLGTDIPVPGDYDGDGRADITVYRPSEGGWFRKNSSNGAIVAINYGIPGDKPIPSGYVPIQ